MEKLKKIFFSETFCFVIVLTSVIGLVIAALVFLFCSSWKFSGTIDETIIGQFGDFVGGVIGTLLAFAASLLYFIALKEQQKDVKTNQDALNQQIEEFSKQVEELEKSREVNQRQLDTMALQQYESTFYSYFNIYTQVKDKMSDKDSDHSLRSVIVRLKEAILQERLVNMSSIEAYAYAIDEYCKLFVSNRSDISHYFRTLYRLLTIADSCPLNGGNGNVKMKYIKIIRSQLSDDELLLIYYNCHSTYAGKSRRLISEYNLLKHLSPIHKFEIINRFQIGDDVIIRIENFYDIVSPHIVEFVNFVCDNFEDAHEKEMEVKNMNCIFKMEYDEDIVFSIVCKKSNANTENLTKMFMYLLHDLLFLSQFESGEKTITTNNSTDSSTGYSIYTYTVQVEDIKKITIDKK